MKALDILKVTCDSLLKIVDEAESLPLSDEFQDKIITFGKALDEIKNNDDISIINELSESLKELSEEAHPSLYDCNTLKIIAILIEKLAGNMQTEDWDGEFGLTSTYKVFELNDDKYHVVNARYTSRFDPDNPMLLIDCRNIDDFEDFINKETGISNLILGLLCGLDRKKTYKIILLGSSLISNSEIELESRVEFIKLNAVMQGKVLFKPQEYVYNPVNITVKYDPSINYYQFADIVSVMNEYNIHKNILDKYLRIYQVIENYMYKCQICEMCDDFSYRKISIRDFKNLSEKLASKELDALKCLLKGCASVMIDSVSLEDHIANKWKSIIDANRDLKSNTATLMRKLGISSGCPTYSSSTSNQILLLTGKLIYQIRCTIVHDKVNEHHITYDNLDIWTKTLLETFLMPCMELIVYGLIFNSNSVVMYQQREINLY